MGFWLSVSRIREARWSDSGRGLAVDDGGVGLYKVYMDPDGARTSLGRLGEALRDACRRLGRSEKTAYLYVGWARRFIMFHRNTHPAELGVEHVRLFLVAVARARSRSRDRGLSRNQKQQSSPGTTTQNQALHALRFLYLHVLQMPLDPAGIKPLRAKQTARLPEAVSRQTINRFLDHLSGIPRVVAYLQVGCGLRLSEALALRVSDLRLEEGIVSVRGSRERSRDVPIPAGTVELMREYLHLNGRTKLDDDFLFVGERKRRVGGTLRSMPLQEQVIRRAFRDVRPRLSPHLLRQSYAIHELDQGVHVALVHHRLGQRDFHATLRYASVSRRRTTATVRSPADDHLPGP